MTLNNVLELAKKNHFDEALSICNNYIDYNKNPREGYAKRAQVFAIKNELENAIADINSIEQIGLANSGDYFSRGRWKLMLNDLLGAIKDLTSSIELEAQNNESYYMESSYFYRAVAYVFSDEKEKAISDCKHVRDDFQVYLKGGIHTKSDLLKLCNNQ